MPETIYQQGSFTYLLGGATTLNTTADTVSELLNVSEFRDHAYQWVNTGGTGSITVDTSIDGLNWSPLATLTAATGVARLEGVVGWVRVTRNNTVNGIRFIWSSRDFYSGSR